MSHEANVVVGRRYLEKGFLDEALRLFQLNADKVLSEDWCRLRDCLMEKERVEEAIRVSQIGQVPLPREELLRRGDRYLTRKEVEKAIHFYQAATADPERWVRVVDVLVEMPGKRRHAQAIADKYLVGEQKPAGERIERSPRHIKAVK